MDNFSDSIKQLPTDDKSLPNHDELVIINSLFPTPSWYKRIEDLKPLVVLCAVIIALTHPSSKEITHGLVKKIPHSIFKNSTKDSFLILTITAIIIVSIFSIVNKTFI